MKYRVIVAGILAVAIAAPMQAQTCSTQTADACQKAVDLLNFMTPQLSTALVGGNPTLGQGGVLGGLGHFSIDIRASGSLSFELPKLKLPLARMSMEKCPRPPSTPPWPSVGLPPTSAVESCGVMKLRRSTAF